MEVPPNLNATTAPIESNENNMSCRGWSLAALSPQRHNAVATNKPVLLAGRGGSEVEWAAPAAPESMKAGQGILL